MISFVSIVLGNLLIIRNPKASISKVLLSLAYARQLPQQFEQTLGGVSFRFASFAGGDFCELCQAVES